MKSGGMIILILKWLDRQAKDSAGVTWGTPWGKGVLNRDDSISLSDTKGRKIGVQSWPTAFWPDGSVKWTGHAAVLGKEVSENYQLDIHETPKSGHSIKVNNLDHLIEIDTGKLLCQINKEGTVIIKQLKLKENIIGTNGKLIAVKEEITERPHERVATQRKLVGDIRSVVIEQSGPVRAVIKIDGIHIDHLNNEELLPFTIRLYFYVDVADIRIVHTFVYDGDPNIDFITGLGLEFKGELSGAPWNRHIQVAGEEGMYSEPGQLALTRRYDGDLYTKQIAGERIDPTDIEGLADHICKNARWNDFKIVQDSANHYYVTKRTEEGCSWVESLHGERAHGLLYAGGIHGGLAVGIKDFWQKHPSSLEINDLTEEESTIKIWLWSPDGKPMDLRHYSKHTHVDSAYEGFDEMRATPEGIANTGEIYISCFASQPTSEYLFELAKDWQEKLLLVCEPSYYVETNTLGHWSVPHNDNPFIGVLEQQLDQIFQFYKKEIDQRNWYGYWNYGDVMHTYDSVRHQWRYDVGGYAWQNTELVPNIWLWYTFLRTGQVDAFNLAEAMTRHTSEVDRYHLGEYAGLGSRHNVVHWGCGCKEARISSAGLHKYYYFLTSDERIGDLLTEVRDVDYKTVDLDPLRAYFPKDEYPTHVRVGTDWSTFCSNWLSEWERTENEIYLKKILTGLNLLKSLPLKLLSGPVFGYDPKTSELHHMGDGIMHGFHMAIAFGAPQLWIELVELLDDQELEDMVVAFGEFYMLNNREKLKKSGGLLNDDLFNWPMFSAGLVAYAANKKQDDQLAQKAWNLLLDNDLSHTPLPIEEKEVKSWKTLTEIPWVTTNTISQWSLNLIMCIKLIGHMLPEEEIQQAIIKFGK